MPHPQRGQRQGRQQTQAFVQRIARGGQCVQVRQAGGQQQVVEEPVAPQGDGRACMVRGLGRTALDKTGNAQAEDPQRHARVAGAVGDGLAGQPRTFGRLARERQQAAQFGRRRCKVRVQRQRPALFGNGGVEFTEAQQRDAQREVCKGIAVVECHGAHRQLPGLHGRAAGIVGPA